MVIAIFRGQGANNAGLKIDTIYEEKDKLVFRFQEKHYQTVNNIDKVSVYGFFVLPYTEKEIIIEKKTIFMHPNPPKVEKCIKFDALTKTK